MSIQFTERQPALEKIIGWVTTKRGFWGKLIATALSIAIVAGCVMPGKSTVIYFPPNNPTETTKNEVVVDKPFDSVWDALVHNLAKSFYVINTIEKQSRIINISFSTDVPETYVDCGTTTRTYSRGDENQTYKYNTASSSKFKIDASRDNNSLVTEYISRQGSLEGRMNIYIAPEDQGTRVSVNTRYILSVNIQGYYTVEDAYGRPIGKGELPPQKTYTVTFSTNQPATVDWGTPEDPLPGTCHSLGRLEKDILQFVQSGLTTRPK